MTKGILKGKLPCYRHLEPLNLTTKRSPSREVSQQKRFHSRKISQPRDLTAEKSHSEEVSQQGDLTEKRVHS
jgi:hypothetical protein